MCVCELACVRACVCHCLCETAYTPTQTQTRAHTHERYLSLPQQLKLGARERACLCLCVCNRCCDVGCVPAESFSRPTRASETPATSDCSLGLPVYLFGHIPRFQDAHDGGSTAVWKD